MAKPGDDSQAPWVLQWSSVDIISAKEEITYRDGITGSHFGVGGMDCISKRVGRLYAIVDITYNLQLWYYIYMHIHWVIFRVQ